jgi:CO/xanthine dehydrogenase FAD-binding subunit
VPPLLVLDAEVELRSASRARHLSVGEFILGNRLTARRPDELVTAIRVPKAAAKGRSHFVKLGARRYLVISIAMTAVRVVSDASGRIEEAAIAVGACSPVAQRIAGLEAAMKGAAPGELEALVAEYSFDELQPIDDVRATADYRRQAAREIVSRAVLASLREETGRAAA